MELLALRFLCVCLLAVIHALLPMSAYGQVPSADAAGSVTISSITAFPLEALWPRLLEPREFEYLRVPTGNSGMVPFIATHSAVVNGFPMSYVLRGRVSASKLACENLNLSDVSEPSLSYTDARIEFERLTENDIDSLIEALRQPNGRPRFAGAEIPGGHVIRFSDPMLYLVMFGERARERVERFLDDREIQNAIVLILGAIGNEYTVPKSLSR